MSKGKPMSLLLLLFANHSISSIASAECDQHCETRRVNFMKAITFSHSQLQYIANEMANMENIQPCHARERLRSPKYTSKIFNIDTKNYNLRSHFTFDSIQPIACSVHQLPIKYNIVNLNIQSLQYIFFPLTIITCRIHIATLQKHSHTHTQISQAIVYVCVLHAFVSKQKTAAE